MIRAARLAALLLCCTAGTVLAADEARTLTGAALVMDGDTIMMSLTKLMLAGVDAPEPDQTCFRPDGTDWRCGAEAAAALAALVDGKAVTCVLTGRRSHQRPVARCRVGDQDLAAWLATQGWAVVDPRFEQTYLPQQQQAKAARRGVWSGSFEQPCVFRGSC